MYVASGGCPVPTCPAVAPYPRFSGLEIYDPQTNSWSAGAPIPIAIYNGASAVIDGKLYVAGGQGQNGVDDTGALQIYNAATNSWSFGATMPLRGSGLAGAALDGKFYVVGNVPYLSGIQALRAYDPVTNTWQMKAAMPTGRAGARAAAVDGLLYVVGGWNGAYLTTVEVYDPATNTWQSRTPMPTARANLSVVARNGIIYAIGGDNNAQTYNIVEAYDPALDAWAAVDPMPAAHTLAVGGVLGDALHVVSGYEQLTGAGFSASNHAFVFGSAAPSDTTAPVITPTVTGTPGNDGWYTSDVSVSWNVSDPESPFTTSGCGTQTVTSDTNGVAFTCSATSAGGASSASVTIKRDTAGPVIASATANPSVLWPPNNKMVAAKVEVDATDAGSGLAGCSISAVGSNEGGSVHGPSVELTAALTMSLRAERHGAGSGRVYTAHLSCRDVAGNRSTATATVTVPHDQGRRR